ncbi:MAG: hypothetical protein ACI4JC_08735 [Faecalibacterium sp.]
MKMRSVRLAACLLCLLLTTACGASAASASAASTVPAAVSLESAAGDIEEENSLNMTQTVSVRKTTYENKSDFQEFLSAAQPAWIIPGLKESMIPQGMDYCASNGLVYISGYYTSDALPSTLVALDAESGSFVAEYYLYNSDGSPFSSHVGGLAVTDTTLYVSARMDTNGNYSIAAIPLEQLAPEGSHKVTIERSIPLPVSPSFLSYSQGYLWAGNFYHPGANYGLSSGMQYTTASADGDYGCYILGYDLSGGEESRLAIPEGGAYPLPDVVLAAPNKIQGMVLCADGTMTLSQSYGRKNNSSLLRFDLCLNDEPDTTVTIAGQELPAYILDSGRAHGSLTAMPMTEALADGPDGSILVLFESGASHYSNGSDRTDHVWQLRYAD